MTDRAIKFWHRNTCVRLRIVTASHRERVHYRVPDENNVVVVGEFAYKIDDAHFWMFGKIPTYYFFENCGSPIDLFSPGNTLDAGVFKVAYDNKIAKDVATVTDKKSDVNMFMLAFGVAIVACLVVIVFLGKNQIDALNTKIDELNALLRTIGGM